VTVVGELSHAVVVVGSLLADVIESVVEGVELSILDLEAAVFVNQIGTRAVISL